MLDKEKALRLLEEVSFNKDYLYEIKETGLYDDFVFELLSRPEELKSWDYYGQKPDYRKKLVAGTFITYMIWEESGM